MRWFTSLWAACMKKQARLCFVCLQVGIQVLKGVPMRIGRPLCIHAHTEKGSGRPEQRHTHPHDPGPAAARGSSSTPCKCLASASQAPSKRLAKALQKPCLHGRQAVEVEEGQHIRHEALQKVEDALPRLLPENGHEKRRLARNLHTRGEPGRGGGHGRQVGRMHATWRCCQLQRHMRVQAAHKQLSCQLRTRDASLAANGSSKISQIGHDDPTPAAAD